MFSGITDTVTYLTIYDKFMLSRKIQKLRKYFFDWSQSKKYKTNFIWYFTGRNSKNTKHESSATRWPYRTSYDPAYTSRHITSRCGITNWNFISRWEKLHQEVQGDFTKCEFSSPSDSLTSPSDSRTSPSHFNITKSIRSSPSEVSPCELHQGA